MMLDDAPSVDGLDADLARWRRVRRHNRALRAALAAIVIATAVGIGFELGSTAGYERGFEAAQQPLLLPVTPSRS